MLQDDVQKTTKINHDDKVYVGTKIIRAIPMTEEQFNKEYRKRNDTDIANEETQGDGYRVTYEDGYISWSPKAVFERCYREISISEFKLITP